MESCWVEVVSIGDNRMRNFLQSCGQSLLSLAHQLPEKVPRGVSMRPCRCSLPVAAIVLADVDAPR